MQVVYSGGSSTPSPSPRLQRKAHNHGGYGRPVMPGYLTGYQHQVVVQRSRSREKLTEGDTSLRDSIPAMSKPVAVTCLVLNVVLPGFGTFISGLTVLCGSHVRPKGATRRSVVWANSWVALLQFLLTFLLLLGWIWSIMWGTAFLTISDEYYKKGQVEEVSAGPGTRPKSSPTTKRDHARNGGSSHSASPYHTGRTRSPSFPDLSAIPSHSNGLSVTPVSAVGGSTPNIYLTPCSASSSTGTTSSTMPHRNQPIIVLQEAPITVNHSDTPPAPSRVLMNARTRHEKILQRQMSDNELSPFILTHQKLEAIVIHDAPILSRPHRPQLTSVDDLDPSHVPLPKL